jgi:CSLREA domain-containing protein
VTIAGTNFVNVTAVSFGTESAISFTVGSSGNSPITAIVPAGSVSTVDVIVTARGGSSATNPSDHFTYVAAPTITQVSPSAGPVSGATSVTITGTNFTGATAVSFGTTAATSFAVNGDTSITAVAPAGSAGTVDITVTSVGGTSAASSADQFTYAAVPTITQISPASGLVSGGTPVTVTGTNFIGGQTSVAFGASTIAASSVTVNSATSLTVTSPAQAAGTIDITVTTPGGTSATSSADQFTYTGTSSNPAPTISSVSPAAGSTAGGTSVTITGTGFTGASAVNFGATAAASFTFNSDSSITAIAPAASSAGLVDITVKALGGTSATSASDQFTYNAAAAAPTVTGVSPAYGLAAGGTSVTITGTGFTGATAVIFGHTSLTSGFSVNVAGTQITIATPAGTGGDTVDVTVAAAGGTSAISEPADQFAYITPSYVVNSTSDDNGSNALQNCNAANLTASPPVQTCTLRDAILVANQSPTTQTITFDPSVFATAQTIDISANEPLTISGKVSIIGSDAGVAIDGGSATRILYVAPGATAAVQDLTFQNGNAVSDSGGAIENEGTLTVANCTFTGNVATYYGGAIENAIPNSGNTSPTLTISNSTFTGNTATQLQGGAISNFGVLTMDNSTLTGNSAPSTQNGFAGGIESFGYTNVAITATVSNSIVAGNSAGNSAPDVYGISESSPSSNLIGTPPQLAPLGNYGGPTPTMIPLPGSPAICAGVADGATTADQRGAARPNADSPGYSVNPCVDIGAVQTHYALSFNAQPGNVQVNTAMATAPVVTLMESLTTFDSANYPVLAGASLGSLALTDASSALSGSPTSAAIDVASGTATLSSLSFSQVATGDTLIAALALNASPAVTVSATSSAFDVTAAPLAQPLSFGSAPTLTVGSTGTVTVMGTTPNSGNAVTLASSTPLICSITITASTEAGASGTLTGIAEGNCTIIATQAAGGNYTAASASQTIAVGPATLVPTTLSLTATPNPATLGQAVTLTATVGESVPTSAAAGARFTASRSTTAAVEAAPTGTVTFTDNGNGIGSATLGMNGTASLTIATLATGKHNLTASYSGDGTHASATASQIVVTINAGTTGVQGQPVPAPVSSWWMLISIGLALAFVSAQRMRA